MKHISAASAVFVLILLRSPSLWPASSAAGGTLMAGTRYATRYTVLGATNHGPRVMIVGGVHGDEVAGYKAALMLTRWQISYGTLILLPEAHKEAIRRGVRAYPGNMNNMFPGKADGSDMERLAYQIFRLMEDQHPSLLLTLHESVCFHADDPACYGQTLCYDFPLLDPIMQSALDRINPHISASRHRFSLFVEPHPHCPTYQAWVKLKVPAASIETCRELPLELRIRYQLMMVEAFLDKQGVRYVQHDVPPL